MKGIYTLFEAWAMSVLVAAALIPAVVLYCSYLWAYVGIMAAVILGPLFIPWMLVPQLDWLFWSWFKSLVKLSVHMMIAATLFVICAEFAMLPIQRLSAQLFSNEDLGLVATGGSLFGSAISSMIAYVPIMLLMWLMCTKTGEMASMVTDGGGMPAAGMSGLAGGASSLASSGVGRAATGAGMKAAGVAAGVATAGVATAVTVAASVVQAGAKFVSKAFSGK